MRATQRLCGSRGFIIFIIFAVSFLAVVCCARIYGAYVYPVYASCFSILWYSCTTFFWFMSERNVSKYKKCRIATSTHTHCICRTKYASIWEHFFRSVVFVFGNADCEWEIAQPAIAQHRCCSLALIIFESEFFRFFCKGAELLEFGFVISRAWISWCHFSQ